MKTLLTFALIIGISALASADPKFAGEPKDKPLTELTSVRSHYQKIKITFDQAMDKVVISILDPEGELIARNKYKTKEAVTVPFDLSQLPEGAYQVKIETKEETAVFNVVTVEKKETIRPLMAYGKLKNRNTVNLLVVGLEKPGVRVDIYNEYNQKINSEYIDQSEGFSKDYRFVGKNASTVYFLLTDSKGRSKYVYPKAVQPEKRKR